MPTPGFQEAQDLQSGLYIFSIRAPQSADLNPVAECIWSVLQEEVQGVWQGADPCGLGCDGDFSIIKAFQSCLLVKTVAAANAGYTEGQGREACG